jgi:beta-glucosidase
MRKRSSALTSVSIAGVWAAAVTGSVGTAATAPATFFDSDRITFLRNYLAMLQRATSEGVPVHGYFLWSLLDNFEWSSGFGTRFGLFLADHTTQRRSPKLSAAYYSEVINRNALP